MGWVHLLICNMWFMDWIWTKFSKFPCGLFSISPSRHAWVILCRGNLAGQTFTTGQNLQTSRITVSAALSIYCACTCCHAVWFVTYRIRIGFIANFLFAEMNYAEYPYNKNIFPQPWSICNFKYEMNMRWNRSNVWWWWWSLVFYDLFCALGRLSGPSDLQR